MTTMRNANALRNFLCVLFSNLGILSLTDGVPGLLIMNPPAKVTLTPRINRSEDNLLQRSKNSKRAFLESSYEC